jgi:hypothetical protein
MKFTKTYKTQLKVKDAIILHLQFLIKTRPEVEEVIDVFKNYIKDIKYKYDKEQAIFDWDVIPINNSTEVIDKITKVMALDIVTGVVQFIEGVRPVVKPKGVFKMSGHLVDQLQKYKHPKDESQQLSLWETIGGIKSEDVEEYKTSEIIEGINLTPTETKLIDSVCKLLDENSQTVDPKKENYFTGNLEPSLQTYGDDKTPAPKLSISLYELTKEFKGGDKVSGNDVKNVAKVLHNLKDKSFRIKYKEILKGKKKDELILTYDKTRPLLFVDDATATYKVDGVEKAKKHKVIIILHPIFRRQIDSKFVLFPYDITKRTILAYGNNKVSKATLALRIYLLKELALKHYSPEIMLDRLYWMLSNKDMNESRKVKVKKDTDKALETVINLGLLKSYKIEPAKTTGEPKVVFTINRKFI